MTRLTRSTSGSTLIVRSAASLVCGHERGFNIDFTDPIFYVPLTAIESGPAKLSKASQGEEGFWMGSVVSGDKKTEVTVYEKGPLKGLVKFRPTDIGQSSERSLCIPNSHVDNFGQNGLPKMRSSLAATPKTLTNASRSSHRPEQSALRLMGFLWPKAAAICSYMRPC